MRKKIAISLAVASVLTTSGVWGLGLGNIESQSALNQPLNAEIHLLSADAIENSQLKASIASYETYEKQGIARSGLHNQIRFVTVTKPNGEKVIRLSTREPLKEPFLNFLVEVEWPQGRLLREYTLLLDPPTYAAKTAPVLTPARAGGQQSATAATRRPAAASAPASRTSRPPVIGSGDRYTIRRNDTLWSIASQARPDNSVSVQQTLAAIYRANPQAFVNNDINRIETGETLEIPSLQEIRSVPARGALRDMVRNTEAASGPALDARQERPAATSAREATQAGGRLSLAGVPDADGENSGSGAGGDARDEQAMNLEATETLRRENRELRSRLETMNERLDTLERLLTLQDPELAAMAAEADNSELEQIAGTGADEQAAEEPTGTPIGGNDDAAVDTDAAVPASGELATGSDSAVAGPVQDEASSQQAEQASAQPAMNKLPAQAVAPIGRRDKERGFFEAGNVWMWTALGGLLALILAAVWWLRRRSDEQDHEFAMAAEDKVTLPAIGGDDLLTDLEEDSRPLAAAPKASDAAEVEESTDLAAEAEALMDQDRYREAEALWKVVVANYPEDRVSQLQLLMCYAETGSDREFEELADQLQAEAGTDPLIMEEIARLRATLEDQELATDSTDADDMLILPSEDEIFGNRETDEATEEPAAETEVVSSEEDDDNKPGDDYFLDDELGLVSTGESQPGAVPEQDLEEATEAEAAPESNLDEGLEFTLDDLQDADDDTVDEPDEEHGNIIEFESSGNADVPAGSDEEFDEDLLAGEGDQAATKLDLARAYVDMGDEEAARDILTEVVVEGTPAQQTEATELLERLG